MIGRAARKTRNKARLLLSLEQPPAHHLLLASAAFLLLLLRPHLSMIHSLSLSFHLAQLHLAYLPILIPISLLPLQPHLHQLHSRPRHNRQQARSSLIRLLDSLRRLLLPRE